MYKYINRNNEKKLTKKLERKNKVKYRSLYEEMIERQRDCSQYDKFDRLADIRERKTDKETGRRKDRKTDR